MGAAIPWFKRLSWVIIPLAVVCLGYLFGTSRVHSESPLAKTAAHAPSSAATPRRVTRAGVPARDIERLKQSIAGWVATERGARLSGARVCAVCASCDISISPSGHCGVSDASGKFVLDDVSTGMFLVTASLRGFQVGVAHGGKPVRILPGTELEGVAIELAAGETSLTGLVLDATGGPIHGAAVQVAPIGYSVRPLVELETDAEGRFSTSMSPGKVAIRAEAAGYAPALLYRILPSSDATLRLEPGGTIEGQVVDIATGNPVPGVDVSAVGTLEATLLPAVASRADGRFSLYGLAPGRYGLVAEGDRHRGTSSGALNVGFGELISGVVLPVTSGVSVSGLVLVGSGEQPCTEGFVQLGPSSPRSIVSQLGEATADPPSNAPATSALAQIDSMGQVRLRGLSPGRYYVSLECRGHVFADGPKLLDLDDDDRSVTWRVTEGLGLAVFVKDEAGEPIPYAKLALELPPGAGGTRVVRGLKVDANGRASMAGTLYPGNYVLLPHESYGVPPVPVELISGGGTREIEIVVPGSSALTVHVRSPGGEPVEDVQVVASAHAAEAASATDPASTPRSRSVAVAMGMGRFLIRPLPAGSYRVEVLAGGNPPSLAAGPSGGVISLRQGEHAAVTVNLDCEFGLSGKAVDGEGAPVPDVWVTAVYQNAAGSGEELERDLGAPELPRVLTDAEGQFALSGLCGSARYLLRAEQDGRSVGQLLQVQPGREVDLIIQQPPLEAARLSSANARR